MIKFIEITTTADFDDLIILEPEFDTLISNIGLEYDEIVRFHHYTNKDFECDFSKLYDYSDNKTANSDTIVCIHSSIDDDNIDYATKAYTYFTACLPNAERYIFHYSDNGLLFIVSSADTDVDIGDALNNMYIMMINL